jgi:hypothetical protein
MPHRNARAVNSLLVELIIFPASTEASARQEKPRHLEQKKRSKKIPGTIGGLFPPPSLTDQERMK